MKQCISIKTTLAAYDLGGDYFTPVAEVVFVTVETKYKETETGVEVNGSHINESRVMFSLEAIDGILAVLHSSRDKLAMISRMKLDQIKEEQNESD